LFLQTQIGERTVIHKATKGPGQSQDAHQISNTLEEGRQPGWEGLGKEVSEFAMGNQIDHGQGHKVAEGTPEVLGS
jgi:hypothetical protein